MGRLVKQLLKAVLSCSLIVSVSSCTQKTPHELTSETGTKFSNDQALNGAAGLASVQEKLTEALKNNLLDKLDNSLTICSINDIPLTMGDFRKSLKDQQDQIKANLAISHDLKESLLTIAKQRSISLTPAEKANYLKAARNGQGGNASAFAKTLKSHNISQSDFDTEVLQLGLALKTSGQVIQEKLLRQMVDRELLASAAKAAGFTKQAVDTYIKVKRSPDYQKSLTSSGLTEEDAHSKIVTNQLCQLMIKKIQSGSAVTEKEIRQFYDANKAQLKHGSRIRFSQIVIRCPQEDSETTVSLRTRIRNSNPKLTDSQLDKTVEFLENEQRQRAEKLLQQALKGADFAVLANLNTQDDIAHNAKNGGDIGFQDVSALSKPLASKLSKLKINEVCNEVIPSSYGFHIIKVTAKEPPGVLPFDECEDRIRQLLSQQRDQESLTKWLDEKIRTAKITISPEFQALVSSDKPASK